MLISIPYVYFLLPETKGIPLDKMDRLFDMRPRHSAGPRLHRELQAESAGQVPQVSTLNRTEGSDGDSTPEKTRSLDLNTA